MLRAPMHVRNQLLSCSCVDLVGLRLANFQESEWRQSHAMGRVAISVAAAAAVASGELIAHT